MDVTKSKEIFTILDQGRNPDEPVRAALGRLFVPVPYYDRLLQKSTLLGRLIVWLNSALFQTNLQKKTEEIASKAFKALQSSGALPTNRTTIAFQKELGVEAKNPLAPAMEIDALEAKANEKKPARLMRGPPTATAPSMEVLKELFSGMTRQEPALLEHVRSFLTAKGYARHDIDGAVTRMTKAYCGQKVEGLYFHRKRFNVLPWIQKLQATGVFDDAFSPKELQHPEQLLKKVFHEVFKAVKDNFPEFSRSDLKWLNPALFANPERKASPHFKALQGAIEEILQKGFLGNVADVMPNALLKEALDFIARHPEFLENRETLFKNLEEHLFSFAIKNFDLITADLADFAFDKKQEIQDVVPEEIVSLFGLEEALFGSSFFLEWQKDDDGTYILKVYLSGSGLNRLAKKGKEYYFPLTIRSIPKERLNDAFFKRLIEIESLPVDVEEALFDGLIPFLGGTLDSRFTRKIEKENPLILSYLTHTGKEVASVHYELLKSALINALHPHFKDGVPKEKGLDRFYPHACRLLRAAKKVSREEEALVQELVLHLTPAKKEEGKEELRKELSPIASLLRQCGVKKGDIEGIKTVLSWLIGDEVEALLEGLDEGVTEVAVSREVIPRGPIGKILYSAVLSWMIFVVKWLIWGAITLQSRASFQGMAYNTVKSFLMSKVFDAAASNFPTFALVKFVSEILAKTLLNGVLSTKDADTIERYHRQVLERAKEGARIAQSKLCNFEPNQGVELPRPKAKIEAHVSYRLLPLHPVKETSWEICDPLIKLDPIRTVSENLAAWEAICKDPTQEHSNFAEGQLLSLPEASSEFWKGIKNPTSVIQSLTSLMQSTYRDYREGLLARLWALSIIDRIAREDPQSRLRGFSLDASSLFEISNMRMHDLEERWLQLCHYFYPEKNFKKEGLQAFSKEEAVPPAVQLYLEQWPGVDKPWEFINKVSDPDDFVDPLPNSVRLLFKALELVKKPEEIKPNRFEAIISFLDDSSRRLFGSPQVLTESLKQSAVYESTQSLVLEDRMVRSLDDRCVSLGYPWEAVFFNHSTLENLAVSPDLVAVLIERFEKWMQQYPEQKKEITTAILQLELFIKAKAPNCLPRWRGFRDKITDPMLAHHLVPLFPKDDKEASLHLIRSIIYFMKEKVRPNDLERKVSYWNETLLHHLKDPVFQEQVRLQLVKDLHLADQGAKPVLIQTESVIEALQELLPPYAFETDPLRGYLPGIEWIRIDDTFWRSADRNYYAYKGDAGYNIVREIDGKRFFYYSSGQDKFWIEAASGLDVDVYADYRGFFKGTYDKSTSLLKSKEEVEVAAAPQLFSRAFLPLTAFLPLDQMMCTVFQGKLKRFGWQAYHIEFTLENGEAIKKEGIFSGYRLAAKQREEPFSLFSSALLVENGTKKGCIVNPRDVISQIMILFVPEAHILLPLIKDFIRVFKPEELFFYELNEKGEIVSEDVKALVFLMILYALKGEKDEISRLSLLIQEKMHVKADLSLFIALMHFIPSLKKERLGLILLQQEPSRLYVPLIYLELASGIDNPYDEWRLFRALKRALPSPLTASYVFETVALTQGMQERYLLLKEKFTGKAGALSKATLALKKGAGTLLAGPVGSKESPSLPSQPLLEGLDLATSWLEWMKEVQHTIVPLKNLEFTEERLTTHFLSYYEIARKGNKELYHLLLQNRGGWSEKSAAMIRVLSAVYHYPLLFYDHRYLQLAFKDDEPWPLQQIYRIAISIKTASSLFGLAHSSGVLQRVAPLTTVAVDIYNGYDHGLGLLGQWSNLLGQMQPQKPLNLDGFDIKEQFLALYALAKKSSPQVLETLRQREDSLLAALLLAVHSNPEHYPDRTIVAEAIHQKNGLVWCSLFTTMQGIKAASAIGTSHVLPWVKRQVLGSTPALAIQMALKLDFQTKPLEYPVKQKLPKVHFDLIAAEDSAFDLIQKVLLSHAFTVSENRSFIKSAPLRPAINPLVQAGIDRVNRSIDDFESQEKKKKVYTLKDERALVEAYVELEGWIKGVKAQFDRESKRLSKYGTPAELIRYFGGGALPKEVLSSDLELLDGALARHLARSTRILQCQRALSAIEAAIQSNFNVEAVQKVAEELAACRAWKPRELPSRLSRLFLAFEASKGVLLWERQAKAVSSHIIGGKTSSCIELLMSYGKTFFAIPVLDAYFADGKSLVINVFPRALLGQNFSDIKKTLFDLSGMTARGLAVSRSSPPSYREWKGILAMLLHAIEAKECINTSKEDLQAIELLYYEQLDSQDSQGKKIAEVQRQILRLFRAPTTRIIGDEAHELMSTTDELNHPLGKGKVVDPKHQKAFEKVFHALWQFPEWMEAIVSGEMGKIPCDFAERAAFALSHGMPSSFIPFVLGQQSADPSLTGHVHWEEICLIKGALLTLLPLAFKGTLAVDYGKSDREEGAVPFDGNQSPKERSTIRHPFEAFLKTLLLYLHNGLNDEQIKRLKIFLTKEMHEEITRKGCRPEDTETGAFLKKYSPDGINIGRNRGWILLYLRFFVFKKILYWDTSLSSNAQNFYSMFANKTFDTGTPFNSGTYGPDMEMEWNSGTDGEALWIIENKTKGIRPLKESAPKSVLVEILSTYFKPGSSFSALIDGGALLRGMGNREVVEAMAQHFKAAACTISAIDFYDKTDGGEKLLTYLIHEGRVVEHPGRGIPFDQRVAYFDQRHGFGANIPQRPDGKGLVLIGNNHMKYRLFQEVFRMRGIKTTNGGQSVEFLCLDDVYQKISRGKEPTVRDVIEFLLENEAYAVAAMNADAYQLMCSDRVQRFVKDKVLTHVEANKFFHRFRSVIFSTMEVNPEKLFAGMDEDHPTEEFLKRIREGEFAKVNDLAFFTQQELDELRAKLEQIPRLSVRPFTRIKKGDFGKEQVQENEVEKELSTEMHSVSFVTPSNQSVPDYTEIPWRPVADLRSPHWMLGAHLPIHWVSEAAKEIVPLLDNRLWMTNNFLPKVNGWFGGKIGVSDRGMRPLQEVLVHAEVIDGKLKVHSFVALSPYEANFFRGEIPRHANRGGRLVFLWDTGSRMTVVGDRLDREFLQNSPELCLLEAQMKFLNGDVNYSGALLGALEGWIEGMGLKRAETIFESIRSRRLHGTYQGSDIFRVFNRTSFKNM